MTAYIDFAYYQSFGGQVPATDFPLYSSRAQMVIDAATRFYIQQRGLDSLPDFVQTQVKNAVCMQIDYLQEEGLEIVNHGTTAESFTVGKVSVTKGSAAGGLSAYGVLSPGAEMLLEQTGLLSRNVACVDFPVAPFPYWW